MTAPFTPFISEEVYLAIHPYLDPQKNSVHLATYPDAKHFEKYLDEDLAEGMEKVLLWVRLGRSARNQSQMKIRQPLSRAYLCGEAAETKLDEGLQDLIKDELNVKELIYADDSAQWTDYDFKPNLSRVGRRLGKDTPLLKDHLETIDGRAAMKDLQENGSFTVTLPNGHDVKLEEDDVLIEEKPLEGFAAVSEGDSSLALDQN